MPDRSRAILPVAIVILCAGFALLVAGLVLTPGFVEKNIVSDHELGARNREDLATFTRDARWIGILLVAAAVPLFLFPTALSRWFSRRKEALFGVGILLVTVIFAALLGELVLRSLLADQSHGIGGQDPATLKLMRSLEMNGEGFRDREWGERKSPGTTRILLLGDSFTFGAGVPRSDSLYTRHLERELNGRPGPARYEILNAGTPGWNTKQEVDFLEERGFDFRPDIAVLAYVLNDAEEEDAAYREISFLPEAYERRIKSRSYLYYFLNSRVHRLCERFGLVDSYHDYLLDLYQPGAAYRSEHRRQIVRFVEKCRLRGVVPLIIIWPIFFEMNDYPFEIPHRFVLEIAQEKNVPVLDLIRYFRDFTAEELIVNPFDYHPNEAAHRMAAGELHRWMERIGLLPPAEQH